MLSRVKTIEGLAILGMFPKENLTKLANPNKYLLEETSHLDKMAEETMELYGSRGEKDIWNKRLTTS